MRTAEMARCDGCGFDEADWEARDRTRILRHSADWLDEVTPGASREVSMPGDLHEVQHLLWQAGRDRWAGTPSQSGTVEQINAGHGGVPKLPVPEAVCGRRGLQGDRQEHRRHHGAPLQALCLWSADVIEALQREGHPIGFGSAGENLTVRGLDWSRVAPGQRWNVGALRIETTAWAVPCRQNAAWFTGGDFRRMSHPLHPGWSRVYARVLRTGPVSVGDPVVVEPDLAGWEA